MNRRLVATLGPASWALARGLADAGVDAFRLNASHMIPAALGAALARLREAVPSTPVIVDLQGAKMRLGDFEPVALAPGARVVLGAGGIPLPHPEIFRAVRAGETLSCDDDRVRLCVERTGADGLEATVLAPGTLRPRKGINVVEHPVDLDGLSAADRAHLDAVPAALPGPAFAFSFMRDGREAGWIRQARPGARVTGKIERREALEALDAIGAVVDEIWICRGDLGAQLGPAALARSVASLDPRRLPVPVLMAGQVLEHLTHHAEPTRSEVCHLHDLAARGYAGIVLSDETAIGDDPVRAAAAARALLDGHRR